MAKGSGQIPGKRPDVTPQDIPDVPPPMEGGRGFDFSVQAIIEMQRTLGELNTKVDRLINDVDKQGDKIDNLRIRMAWLAGIAVAIAAIVTIFWTVASSIPWDRLLK